jgi:hypothetical protein
VEVYLDGPPERWESERTNFDPRVNRLIEAVRDLDGLGRAAAAEALAQASEALDRLAFRSDDEAPPQDRFHPPDSPGAVPGICRTPSHGLVDNQGRRLREAVIFSDVSPEENHWVDAGTVGMLLQQVLGQLANRHGSPLQETFLSVDYLALVPRNRELSLAARAEPAGAHVVDVYASISDSTNMLVEAHARFVRS